MQLLGVNAAVITPAMLKDAMQTELEHGTRDMRTNVTNDDLILTAKIALAHFTERLDYYLLLHELERTPLKPIKTMKPGKPGKPDKGAPRKPIRRPCARSNDRY